jgi:hypothetical protein
MSKTMAEVIREELRKGSYQMPADKLPYETQAASIAGALTAAGFGDVREAAAAGLNSAGDVWGAGGRVTIRLSELWKIAGEIIEGEWDQHIHWNLTDIRARKAREAHAKTQRGES